MMQLVLRDGVVFATHADDQRLAELYPGLEIVTSAISCKPGDPDPRTDAEKAVVYRDQRRLAYPALADQLDMLYHDQVNGTTVWKDTIAAVKTANPKPA